MPLAIDRESHEDLKRQLAQCETDGEGMAAEIERLRARNAEHEAIRFGVMAQVKGVNDINEALEKQIEHLRTTLTTVRLFIEDDMIAHAVVVLEGRDARDPSNPSLLKLINVALGDCEQKATDG